MIRLFTVVMWVIAGVLTNLMTGSEPVIYATFPSEVAAGQVMKIKISIDKGELSQFGRFSQELPLGFTAYSDDEHFSFKDNKVKFLWVSLTAQQYQNFEYSVQVPAGFTGSLTLGGQFSYIFNNEKKFVSLNPVTINVKPASTPDNQISSATVRGSSGNDSVVNTKVSCFRQQKIVSDGIVVKLKIQKGNLGNMAKIIDTIPAGYTIQALDTKEAIVNVEGQSIKYMWMNLPVEPEYVVSYKLLPVGQNSAVPPVITGQFSYSANSITKSVKIIDKNFEQQSGVLADITDHDTRAAAPQTAVVAPPKASKDTATRKIATAQVAKQEAQVHADVMYRIQIAAGHKMVNVKKYFNKFKVTDKVMVEQHEGWLKYIIAGFGDYRDARDYRVKMWQETDVHDAFVAAYNNGQRITVQEALMISNQKWYN